MVRSSIATVTMVRRRQPPQETRIGAAILQAVIAHQPAGVCLKEIMTATGIARSSVQRYLNMLRAEGLVHSQRRRWYAGPPLTAIPKLRPPSQLIRNLHSPTPPRSIRPSPKVDP